MMNYNIYLKLKILFFFCFIFLEGLAQIQISYPLNRMVFQRNASNNATIAITGQYQQIIDRVEARVVSIQGGSTTAWQTIQGNPQGGWFAGTMNVVGGWYQLEVRGTLNGNAVTSTTLNKVGVGEVFVISGQSNAAGYYNFGGPAATDDRVNTVDFYNSGNAATLPQPNFTHLDANSSISPHGQSAWCWGRLGDLIASRFNVPVMFYNTAFDGTLARNWSESADGGATLSGYVNAYYAAGQPFDYLKTALNYYASMTGVRAVLWHQGESDNQLGTTGTNYKAQLQNVINKSRQYFGSNVGWVVARVSYYRGTYSPIITTAQDQVIATTSNVYQGPNSDVIQIPRPNQDIHFQGAVGLTSLGDAWNTYLTDGFFSVCSPIQGSYPTITASCAGGNVNMSVQGVSSVQWSNGTNSTAANLGAGSYNAQAKSSSGNVYFISNFNISNDIAIRQPSISVQGSSTLCQGGSVGLQSSAGNGNTWSNGANSQQINVTSPGTYSVTVRNQYGCVATSTPVTITASSLPPPAQPTISSSSSTTICVGGQTTLMASNSAGYLWSNGSQSQSITVNSSNTYSVRAIDAQGCASAPASIAIQVANPPNPPSIIANGSLEFCQGGQVTLSSTYNSGNTWNNGQTNSSITVISSGSYNVRITDGNGCSSTSNTINVTVNPTPNKPTISPQRATNFCSGNNTVLVSSGENQYNWNNGQTTQSITVSNAGTFFLTVTSNKGCTSPASDPITTNIFPTPSAPSISANRNPVICANENITLNSNPQLNYAWSNGQNGQSITVNQTDGYSVRAIDGNGCYSSPSNTITVNVNPLPSKPTISTSGSTTICQGQQVTLRSNYGNGLVWNTNQNAQEISVGSAGQYSVKYRDGNGCESTSDVTNVTVNSLPATPAINNLRPTTFCEDDYTTLSIPVSSNDYRYNWSTGQNTQDININTNSNITATVTQYATGCTSPVSSPVTIRVNRLPTSPQITANRKAEICANETITFSSDNQPNYFWSSGESSQSITVNKSTNYSVRTKDGNQCFSKPSNVIFLIVNPLPNKPVISPFSSTILCEGQKVTMEANYNTGLTWSTNQTTKQIDVSTAGSYTVKYQDNNGCVSLSDPLSIIVNPLPVAPKIQNERPIVFCRNDSTILAIPAAPDQFYYTWNNGQKTQKIIVKNQGTISATITNIKTGCISPQAEAVSITVNPNPEQPNITTSGPTTFCADQSVTLTANEPTATDYEWNTQANTANIIINKEGSYSVRVSNQFGCRSVFSRATFVKVNMLPPTPTIIAESPTVFCDGDQVALRIDSPNGVFWSNDQTTKRIIITKTSSHKARVRDSNGCYSPFSTTINIEAKTLPPTPTIEKNGIYTLQALGSDEKGSYIWTTDGKPYNDTRIAIKAKIAGSYQVQVAVKHSPTLTCYSKISEKFNYIPETQNNKLGIYPSPTTGLITIETLEDLVNAEINVYSMAGRILNTFRVPLVDERKKFDLGLLPPENYIIEVSANGFHATKKITVMPQ